MRVNQLSLSEDSRVVASATLATEMVLCSASSLSRALQDQMLSSRSLDGAVVMRILSITHGNDKKSLSGTFLPMIIQISMTDLSLSLTNAYIRHFA